MWAIMASPLLISANVRNMSAMNLATYTNKKVTKFAQSARDVMRHTFTIDRPHRLE